MSKSNRDQGGPIDDLVRLLANERCRAVISYFRRIDGNDASLTELATDLSDRGYGRPEGLQLLLRHSILPQLADGGVVHYDVRRNQVHYYGRSDVELVLESVADSAPLGPGDRDE